VHQVLTFSRVRPESRTSLFTDLHTYFPGLLHTLLTYGPHYLTEQELEARLDEHMAAYYKFLGKSVLLRRDQKFWSYHRKKLSEARIGFSNTQVLRGVLATLYDLAANPKSTIEKMIKFRDDSRQAQQEPDFKSKPGITPRLGDTIE